MLSNYFKVIIRNLFKNKLFSIISLTGLSIGIACVIFISIYVTGELAYDTHWKGADRIYRIPLERIYPERVKMFATGSVMLAPTLASELPTVESATRLHRLLFQNDVRTRVGEKDFVETRFLFADSNFFKVFNYEFISGSDRHALSHRTSVVVTESTARRYFGRTDVAGEAIKLDTLELTVTGVVKDQVPTSHLQFDLLGSIDVLPHLQTAVINNSWVLMWVYTYIKVKEGVDPAVLQADIKRIADKFGEANIVANYGKTTGHQFNYFLQPVTSIHLHSALEAELSPNSSIQYVYLLAVIAVIILAITTINYVNLTVSKVTERGKEVGVRKTLGARAFEIKLQIFGESFFLCLAGTLIGAVIVVMFWDQFAALTARTFTPLMVISPIHLVYLLLFIVVLSIAAGVYPSAVFAAVHPSSALKGENKAAGKSVRLRNVLMIAQFSIAIAMITGSMAVYRQMKFLNSKDLGFSPGNVMALRRAQNLGSNYHPFIDKIRQLPGVSHVGYASETALPGNLMGSAVFKGITNPDVSEVRANTTLFGVDFLETLNFHIVEGRGFSESFKDSLGVLINQAGVRAFQLTNPVGAKIKVLSANSNSPELTIVGVAEDYNFTSLHAAITPLVVYRIPSENIGSAIAVKIAPDNFENTLDAIRNTWSSLSSEAVDYSMIDQDIARMYQSDRATSKVFNIFTVLAISMSCIGLLGLTSYLAQQRLKEMSIRRVLGASYARVLLTFASPFIRLTAISMVVAFGVSYYFIREWLATYAYHENLSVGVYLWSALLAALVLAVSLSFQFGRLLRIDMVKALKEN